MYLEDLVIYKRLEEGKTRKTTAYAGVLSLVNQDVSSLLDYIKCRFPDYPDHGINHSIRLLSYIERLLGKQLDILNDTECFCLILAALFHDTAMAEYSTDDRNRLREMHHILASETINDYFNKKLLIIEEHERIKNIVIFASKAHGMDLVEFQNDRCFGKTDTIAGDEVRYNLIGYLVRIGDLMDLEQYRSNSYILSKFKNEYSEEAFNHNIRHQLVTTYNYNEEKLEVEVFANNISQYKIWSTWFTYLRNDILNANTDLNKYNIFFPKPTTNILTSDDKNFDVEELHFEIDDEGGIWNIISQSIYTDKFDFIREIIQNSIDATLIKLYLNEKIKLKYSSPRFWNIEGKYNNILFLYSEIQNKVIIIDSGIGMSKKTVHDFLFKISGTGYKKYENREFAFPSIAKFGIGFVSCLINANEISLYTKAQTEHKLHYVNFTTDANIAFMQDFDNDSFEGTIVSLTLKNQYSYSEIEKYVKQTFAYPSIEIDCINIDKFNDLCGAFCDSYEINESVKSLTEFRNHYELIEYKRREKYDPLTQSIQSIRDILNRAENAKDWLENNYHYDENNSDSSKTEDYKNKIREMNLLIKKLNNPKIKSPYNLNSITEKSLFTETDKHTDVLAAFISNVKNELNDKSNKRKPYESVNSIVNVSKVEYDNTWKTMAVLFNENLDIDNVIINPVTDDIKNSQGILFINNTFELNDIGVEASTINGFLFSENNISKSLRRYNVQYKDSYYGEEKDESIIIGSNLPLYDLKDELEEWYYDRSDNFDGELFHSTRSGNSLSGIVVENNCKSVFVYDNNFYVLDDIRIDDFYNTLSINSNLEDELKNNNNMYKLDMSKCISSLNYNIIDSSKLSSLETMVSNLYQDGIAIPVKINDIFPIAYFRIICNLTDGSRLKLNVTRHKISELSTDIDPWIENVSSRIQEKLLNNVKHTLTELEISIDYNDLFNQEFNDDVFSNENIRQLKSIIKNK